MEMKKKIGILLTLLLLCPAAMYGQKNIDQIFTEFSKEKGVTRVGIGKFAMTFASLFTKVYGVNGIEVLSFDECEQSVRERLNQAITSLNDKSYEMMVSVNEETERTKILIKTDGKAIREMIVMTLGDDPALVRIKGKIKPSNIERVINKNKK